MLLPDNYFLSVKTVTLNALRLNEGILREELGNVAYRLSLFEHPQMAVVRQRAEFAQLLHDLSTYKDGLYAMRAEATLGRISDLDHIFDRDAFFDLFNDADADRFVPVMDTPLQELDTADYAVLREVVMAGYLQPVPLIGVLAVYRLTNGFVTLNPGQPDLRLVVGRGAAATMPWHTAG